MHDILEFMKLRARLTGSCSIELLSGNWIECRLGPWNRFLWAYCRYGADCSEISEHDVLLLLPKL